MANYNDPRLNASMTQYEKENPGFNRPGYTGNTNQSKFDSEITKAYQEQFGRQPSADELAWRRDANVNLKDQLRDIYANPKVTQQVKSSGSGGSGGGSGNGGGGNNAGTDLPIYKGLYSSILDALNAPKFNEANFQQKITNNFDDIAIQAARARRAGAANLIGKAGIEGGPVASMLRETGEAESQGYSDTLQQLAADEQAYLEDRRSKGVATASDLFRTQLGGKTKQEIAAMERDFQMALQRQQLEFSTQQAALDRALERERISAVVNASSKSGGSAFGGFIGGLGGGLQTGMNLGSLFK